MLCWEHECTPALGGLPCPRECATTHDGRGLERVRVSVHGGDAVPVGGFPCVHPPGRVCPRVSRRETGVKRPSVAETWNTDLCAFHPAVGVDQSFCLGSFEECDPCRFELTCPFLFDENTFYDLDRGCHYHSPFLSAIEGARGSCRPGCPNTCPIWKAAHTSHVHLVGRGEEPFVPVPCVAGQAPFVTLRPRAPPSPLLLAPACDPWGVPSAGEAHGSDLAPVWISSHCVLSERAPDCGNGHDVMNLGAVSPFGACDEPRDDVTHSAQGESDTGCQRSAVRDTVQGSLRTSSACSPVPVQDGDERGSSQCLVM
jgi:hypothetical protein